MLKLGMPLLAAVATIGAVPAAVAQTTVGDFYKGKQISLQIGFAPGGGYDISGRLVARHILRHIPDNPTIVVQNLAGGGSLRLLNQLYNVGEKDGSVIGLGSSGTASTPVLTPQAAHYDPRKFSFLGSPQRATLVLLVNSTAPVQTLAQTTQHELTVGASAPGSAILDYPLVFNDIFDTKFKIVAGYEGATQAGLALERGEVDGLVGAPMSSILTTRWNDMWKDGKLKIVAQFGAKADPRIAEVPLFFQPQTDEHRQFLTVLYARDEFGQPFFFPPGVPEARVTALRDAFDATMKDSLFLADAEKTKLDIDPVSGKALQDLAEAVMATPPAVAERLVEIMTMNRKK